MTELKLRAPGFVRRAKRDLRDLYWLINGPRKMAGGADTSVRSLVFVCKGNICRSPFAAAWARSLAPHLHVASAGLRVLARVPSPHAAIEGARRLGVDLSEHLSTPVDALPVHEFDLVVVMEPWHGSVLDAMTGGTNRWTLLSRFDERRDGWRSRAHARYHIEDPYGRDVAVFEDCFRRIQRCVAALVQNCAEAPAELQEGRS